MPEKWYWIDLIGFDCDLADYGADSFLSRTGGEVTGISLLFSDIGFICDFSTADGNRELSPGHCSYGGHRYSEERERQRWTGDKLSGLVRELQKRGVTVTFSIFDFAGYNNDDGKKLFSPHIERNPEVLCRDKNNRRLDVVDVLKRYADGGWFEDYFLGKLREVTDYYGFDGVQVADGISCPRIPVQYGDMSDDIISQFAADSGIKDAELKNCGGDRGAYKRRREYILTQRYAEFLGWKASRWERFYKKLYLAFEDSGKKLLINSFWARDPFEAYVRYGIDYRTTLDGERVYALMVEDVSAVCGIYSDADRCGHLAENKIPEYNREFLLMQQSLKACLPNVRQLTLTPIKDTQEQWNVMRDAPAQQERAIYGRNNNYFFDGGRYVSCSEGPFYCLSDSMRAEDWEYLSEKEVISRPADVADALGFLCVFSESSLKKEAEYYLSTHDYSQTAIKYLLMSAGLTVSGTVRASDAGKTDAPLLIVNPQFYSAAELAALDGIKNKAVVIGAENPLKRNATAEIKGENLSVWVYGGENSGAEIAALPESLKKQDKTAKCKTGFELEKYGIWTFPLKYNELPRGYFRALAAALNEWASLPAVEGRGHKCAVTAFELKDGRYRLLISNNDGRYIIARIRLPFAVRKAVSLVKYKGYEIGIKEGRRLSVRIPPNGMEILEVTR